jgi:hypothetical protein
LTWMFMNLMLRRSTVAGFPAGTSPCNPRQGILSVLGDSSKSI